MKKLLGLALSFSLSLGLLAGCGNSNNKPTESSQGADGTSSAATTAEADATEGSKETEESNSELSGTVGLWTWADSTLDIKKMFEEKNPGITLNVEVFGGDEYKTKLMTTLQSGQNIPDLFMLEEGYIYEFLDSDVIEDLSARGYEDKMSTYYDYMVSSSRAQDGTLRAINYQTSPVGFWYLRDAMKQWMGTDDPVELAGMLDSWDKILEASEKVYKESNGEVYLWPNIVEMVKVVGYSFKPFVRDGQFEISDEWEGLLDTMRTFNESGYVADLGSWGNEWAANWNEGKLLIRVMPSWDFFTDWDKNDGNIGIIKPFENAYEGGTFVSMYSGSENKELADVFLNYLVSPEFQEVNLKEYNQIPADKALTEKLAKDYSSEKFGGQNLLETYNQINDGVYDIVLDKYTRPLQNMFQKHANEGIRNGLDNATILENFKAEVRDSYPELEMK